MDMVNHHLEISASSAVNDITGNAKRHSPVEGFT
ncbi:unnamed protein product [Victoria cruziana]